MEKDKLLFVNKKISISNQARLVYNKIVATFADNNARQTAGSKRREAANSYHQSSKPYQK